MREFKSLDESPPKDILLSNSGWLIFNCIYSQHECGRVENIFSSMAGSKGTKITNYVDGFIKFAKIEGALTTTVLD